MSGISSYDIRQWICMNIWKYTDETLPCQWNAFLLSAIPTQCTLCIPLRIYGECNFKQFSFKQSMESDGHLWVCHRCTDHIQKLSRKLQQSWWTLLVVGNGHQATYSLHKRAHNTTNSHPCIYKCVLEPDTPDPGDIDACHETFYRANNGLREAEGKQTSTI